jgi:hypothetical protein
MKAKEVENLFAGQEDTQIKEVKENRGQDPFVMYEQTYVLQNKGFKTLKEIQDLFRGKKVVVKNYEDDPIEGLWRVCYWIHYDNVRK